MTTFFANSSAFSRGECLLNQQKLPTTFRDEPNKFYQDLANELGLEPAP